MGVGARLHTDGEMRLNDSLNERLPSITTNLVAHYPLDGDKSMELTEIPSSAKTLVYAPNASHVWANWFTGNTVSTVTSDISTISLATAQTYDLVIVDTYVWSVSSTIMTQLKSFVDGGVSCVATGNDTTTNVFVLSKSGAAKSGHTVNIDLSAPVDLPTTSYNNGSTDLIGGINEMITECKPYYRRADTNQVTGYFYKSVDTGAVLYFDQEGTTSATLDYVQAGFLYAYQNNKGIGVNTNPLPSEGGMAIQIATENLLYNNSSDPIDSANDLTSNSTKTYLGDGKYKIVNDGTGSSNFRFYCLLGDLTNGNTYACSIEYENLKGTINSDWCDVGLTGNPSDVNGSGKIYGTASRGTYDSTYRFFDVSLTSGGSMVIFNAQVVEQDFAPAFVDGSNSAGLMSIPNPVTTGNYTVSFKVRVLTDIGFVTGYQTIFQMGNYSQNNTWTIMSTNGTTNNGIYRLIREGNLAEWAWLGADILNASNYDEWNTITIVRDSTNYRAYRNETQVGTIAHLAATMQDTIWIGSRQYNTSAFGASIIKDVSIYDTDLTTAEITELVNGPSKIKESEMITPHLIEEPVMPTDVYYYPLTTDTLDVTKSFVATGDTNVVFVDGSAWVGRGTFTNLVTNPTGSNGAGEPGSYAPAWDTLLHPEAFDPSNWAGGYNSGVGSPSIGYHAQWVREGEDGGPCVKMIDENQTYLGLGHRWLGVSNTFISDMSASVIGVGSTITLSWKQKVDNLGKTGQCGLYHKESTVNTFGTCIFTKSNTKVNTWETMTETYTIPVEWDATTPITWYMYGQGGDYGTVWFDDWQVVELEFAPAFISGTTRTLSYLEYNFNGSIGLDWSGDWSICYWKKPIATSNNLLTGYSIESLGSNSNSVGGGYTWFGKANGSDVINGATPSAFTPAEYFDKWQFISMVKTGTSIETITWGIEGTAKATRSTATTNSVANYYVCQYGYDFKFGWDSGNVTNAYFRDMVVAKRAFTDSEVESLYKQFSIQTDSVNVKKITEQGII